MQRKKVLYITRHGSTQQMKENEKLTEEIVHGVSPWHDDVSSALDSKSKKEPKKEE